MKSISNQSSYYEKYGMLDHRSHAIFIDLKVGVSLDHGVLLCFVSLIALRTCWATFKAKNNIRITPASSALTLI